MRSANLPESDKTKRLKEAENHLRFAEQEREVYNDECRQAAKELKLGPQLPKVVHYSFQQIHFPSSPQQVEPLYFLTPQKCQLFGVCSEAKAEQVNYLIDENDYAGKVASFSVPPLPGEQDICWTAPSAPCR